MYGLVGSNRVLNLGLQRTMTITITIPEVVGFRDARIVLSLLSFKGL